jgi:hypothetical protein
MKNSSNLENSDQSEGHRRRTRQRSRTRRDRRGYGTDPRLLADLIRNLAHAQEATEKRFAAIVRFVQRREATGPAKDMMAQIRQDEKWCKLLVKYEESAEIIGMTELTIALKSAALAKNLSGNALARRRLERRLEKPSSLGAASLVRKIIDADANLGAQLKTAKAFWMTFFAKSSGFTVAALAKELDRVQRSFERIFEERQLAKELMPLTCLASLHDAHTGYRNKPLAGRIITAFEQSGYPPRRCRSRARASPPSCTWRDLW